MKNHTAVRLLLGVAVLASLLGGASRSWAQQGASFTVPFAFEANHQQMPAGAYRVQRLTPHLVSVIDRSTGKYKAFLLAQPERELTYETRGRIIFLRAGKQYMLMQIRFERSCVHANFNVPASLKRELAKQTQANSSNVEVAMK